MQHAAITIKGARHRADHVAHGRGEDLRVQAGLCGLVQALAGDQLAVGGDVENRGLGRVGGRVAVGHEVGAETAAAAAAADLEGEGVAGVDQAVEIWW